MTRIDHLKPNTDSSCLVKDHCEPSTLSHLLKSAFAAVGGPRFAFFLRNAFNSYERCVRVEGGSAESAAGAIEGKMPKRKSDRTKRDTIETATMGLRLRSKRATATAATTNVSATVNSKFFDLSSDDDFVYVKAKRQLRCRNPKFIDSDTWESGRPKRSCNKQKKLVEDEDCPLLDGKEFFHKHELLCSKTTDDDESVPNQRKRTSPPHRRSKVATPLKKCRSSQLSKLNDEAEQFLFPHKNGSSSEEEIERKTKNNVKETKVIETKSTKLAKSDHHDETSMGSSCSDKSINRKKRRRTQAEAFIMDNEKYYKFEMLGSRLRYQGSYLSPIPPKGNNESESKRIKKEPECKIETNSDETVADGLNLLEHQFSFEIIPKHEPWYETFVRQDHGDDIYYSCGSQSDDESNALLLPYQVGPLPPLDPAICISYFNEYTKELLEDVSAPAQSSTTDAVASPSGKGSDSVDEDDSKSGGDDKKDDESSNDAKEGGRKGAKTRVTSGKNPRKSPRQHASTLAILSSLIHQRKRGRPSEQQMYKQQVLPAIAEERDAEMIASLSKDIDQFLANDISDLHLELYVQGDEDEHVAIAGQTDVVHALTECEHTHVRCGGRGAMAVMRTPRYSPTKKRYVRKKKKKNRTGWPNRSCRRSKKGEEKEEGEEVEEQGNSELESTLDSPGFHVEEPEEEEEEEEHEEMVCEASGCPLDPSKIGGVRRLSAKTLDDVSPNSKAHPGDCVSSKVCGELAENNKVNGLKDNCELRGVTACVARRKERKGSSADCVMVAATIVDGIDCVTALTTMTSTTATTTEQCDAADKNANAKLRSEDVHFQPIVRVEKLDSDIEEKHTVKRTRISPVLRRTNRPRRMPASPKSPRILRRPRGRWYREFY